jgi:prevent-host-death family protein
MIRIPISDARKSLAELIEEVGRGERFIITNHGKGAAAIVSVEDLALLEAIEDREGLSAAIEAMADVVVYGAIPWEEAKKELGLE